MLLIGLKNYGVQLKAGTGAIRNQWGSYYWCFVTNKKLLRLCTTDGPVDGNFDHMKIFRAPAIYVLSAIAIVNTLQPHINNKNDPIRLHTNCRDLLKLVYASKINRPSLVLSNHIDIIYRIRLLLQ